MNQKERMQAVLRFEETDRPFFFPTIGFWEETIERWHGEGLPRYMFSHALGYLYFNFDFWLPLPVGDHERPGFFPPMPPKVLEKNGRHEIFRDHSGKVYKRFTDGSSSIPQFLEAPVKNMSDFRKLRWRLRPDFPGRCENPLFDAIAAASRLTGRALCVMFCGLFGFHRHLLGVETLMTAYFDMPDVLHAMSRQWVRLTRGVVRRLVKRYGDITVAFFWEDMCFRSGPLISPNTFREFMSPYYKLVIDDARENGIEHFGVDTDGDCTLVIPLFREAGVDFLWPFEVQAGMDILKVREEHPDLAIWGGLDKRKLALTHDDIEEEVMTKVPPMLKHGGYMPALDHNVPPDVPLDNFKFFLELLKSKDVLP